MLGSACRPRRRRTAVLQRKDKAREKFIKKLRLSFFVFFYFKESFLTLSSTVCPRWRTSSAGFGLSAPIWASSLLTARAPRRERPARLRRRLSPFRFSPLAASSAGGLGVASEAAPVRPYPKTSSTRGRRPCSTKPRQPFRFRWLVSAVRRVAVGRCLFLPPVGSLVSGLPRSFFPWPLRDVL